MCGIYNTLCMYNIRTSYCVSYCIYYIGIYTLIIYIYIIIVYTYIILDGRALSGASAAYMRVHIMHLYTIYYIPIMYYIGKAGNTYVIRIIIREV